MHVYTVSTAVYEMYIWLAICICSLFMLVELVIGSAFEFGSYQIKLPGWARVCVCVCAEAGETVEVGLG